MTTALVRRGLLPRHGVLAAALAAALAATAGITPANAAPPAAPAPTAPATPGGPATVPPPCGPLTAAPPLPLPATTTAAGPVLQQLATHITTVPADAQTGRYTMLSLRMSTADTSIGDCTETILNAADQTRWRDETTNSGRITGTPWHPATDTPPAPTTTWYRPGQLTGVLPGPVPANPVQLATQLDAAYPHGSAAQRVAALADIAAWHDTPLASRQAILHVLADVPGLRSHGTVTVDGYTGIAVSVADGADTYVLIIDARSGEIRAAEDVLTDPQIGRNLGVQTPYSLSRTLFTGRGRSANPWIAGTR